LNLTGVFHTLTGKTQIHTIISSKPLDHNQIDFFIAPRFLLFAAAMCIDSVRLSNRELPNNPLNIRLLSESGGSVPASNGIPLQTEAISDCDNAGTVIVLTSYEPEAAGTPAVLNWIRKQYRQRARMACIETAAFLFIQAKVLSANNHTPSGKLAAHYEAAPGYRELFGDSIALERLYSHEGNLHSSAGAMSTLDLMLHLIEELRGKTIADRIAYVFNHQRLPDTTRKPSRAEGAIAHIDARLGRIVSLMQAAIGNPISLNTIYLDAGVEASTARRLFHRVLQQSPRDYYRLLRLQYGKEILQNSGFTVAQIAEMTGFADGSAFSRAYRQVFGTTPGSDRKYYSEYTSIRTS
jgi:AraC family carnitine catabolism transcriptional activator